MKIRNGFVSNSSSCSFVICNKSNITRSLYDFAHENLYLVDEYFKEFENFNEDDIIEMKSQLIEDAIIENIYFDPGEKRICVFGDEKGTVIGRVYDYMLRDGGSSESFWWKFHEMLR